MLILINEEGIMLEDGSVVVVKANYEKEGRLQEEVYSMIMYRFLEKLSFEEEKILAISGVKLVRKIDPSENNEVILRIRMILKSILQL